jgi:hypothetical protein
MQDRESMLNRTADNARSVVAVALTCLLVCGLAGCRTASMIQPDALSYVAAASGDPSQIGFAIARGARRAGWNAETTDAGEQAIQVRFTLRPQVFVVVQIDYGDGRISFQYLDSSGFRCEPAPVSSSDGCTTIHKGYNARLIRLRSEIEQALVEHPAQPIGVSQAVSIVRQVIEEQPRRNAYTVVDVTEERVSAIREVVSSVYYTSLYNGWGEWPYFGYARPGFYTGYGAYYGLDFADSGYVSTPRADVVYFNNIGRIEWEDTRHGPRIEIWDRYGEPRIRLFVVEPWLAKRFIDAVGVLVKARLAVDENYLAPMGSPQ